MKLYKFVSLAFLVVASTKSFGDVPNRVLSIGGANTEIIYALKSGDKLVGSDTTSYYPPAASALPKVGYMRALSAEGVLSLNPELVILTDEAGPPPVIAQLKQAGTNFLFVKPGRSLEDIKGNIKSIGFALGRTTQASDLIAKMEQEYVLLSNKIENQTAPKTFMFVMQHGGGAPMVSGTATAADSIIKIIGGENVVDGYEGYKPLTPEAAAQMQPDVILVTKRGLSQAGGMNSFKNIPGINLTKAAKEGHIIAMDSLLMLGFGPRTVQAALQLIEMQEAL